MDVPKTIKFILQSQAAFEVNQTRLEGNLTKLEGNLTRLEVDIEHLKEAQYNTEQSLIRIHNEMVERDRVFNEKMNDLGEKIKDTTANLNALIEVVDGIVRRPAN